MTTILALDTSTEACSCALIRGDEIQEKFALVPRQHAQLLLPMIHQLMAEAGLGFQQLDALAFGRGPGSFTGLRIAAGVAQGIAFAANLPVIPVSTLAAIAADAAGSESCTVFSCLDARIDELYWGCFKVVGAEPIALLDEQLCKPELVQLSDNIAQSVRAAGNGLSYQNRMLPTLLSRIDRFIPELMPRSATMARLASRQFARGQYITADQIEPVYLRDKVTHQH